jgi:hypothetical protein
MSKEPNYHYVVNGKHFIINGDTQINQVVRVLAEVINELIIENNKLKESLKDEN